MNCVCVYVRVFHRPDVAWTSQASHEEDVGTSICQRDDEDLPAVDDLPEESLAAALLLMPTQISTSHPSVIEFHVGLAMGRELC